LFGRIFKGYVFILYEYLLSLLNPKENVRKQNQYCGSGQIANYVLFHNIDTMKGIDDAMEQNTQPCAVCDLFRGGASKT